MSLHLVPFGLALGVNPRASFGHVFTQKDPFFPRQFRKSSLIVEPPISRVFMQTPRLGRIYNIVTLREARKILTMALSREFGWIVVASYCISTFKRNVKKSEYSNLAPLEIEYFRR